MSYYIYELVEGPAYPALKVKQRFLAWATARSHLRRCSFQIPDVLCTYGCDVTEDEIEAAVLAETGLKTPWLRYTLDEFVAKLKEDLISFHQEELAALDGLMKTDETPADVTPAQADVVMAPADVVMAPADVTPAPADVTPAPAPVDEIADTQAFLRGRLAMVPRGAGRPRKPLLCAACKMVFPTSDAKYNHVRRGKCTAVNREQLVEAT